MGVLTMRNPHAGKPANANRMPVPGRVLALASAVLIAVSLLFPLWSMLLASPQYPDGLHLNVYAETFKGAGNPDIDDLEEINTLNHYIGMAPIEAQNFPELKLMPAAFGLAGLLMLLAAVFGSKKLDLASLGTLGIAGLAGLVSAYSRLYEYGHHLDPMAPVKIKPFTPVFLGTNQLANFTTTGYLNIASYILLAASLLGFAAVMLRPQPGLQAEAPQGKP